MFHRVVAWNSDVTYVSAGGLRRLMSLSATDKSGELNRLVGNGLFITVTVVTISQLTALVVLFK